MAPENERETGETQATPTASDPEMADEIEQLRRDLEKERAAADDYLKRWQRAQADLINYRRRVEQERTEQAQFASQMLLARLLPLLDDFERAFQSLPRSLERLTWIEGMMLIARRLQLLLEQEGVQRIDALNQPFDPSLHEAVMADEGLAPSEGVVTEVFQQGYRLHGRVLRPSLVRVGRAPDGAASNESASE